MKIGDKILQIIEAKGLKKASLAKKLGISRQTLDNWIDGNTEVKLSSLKKLSNFLDVPISELSGVPNENIVKEPDADYAVEADKEPGTLHVLLKVIATQASHIEALKLKVQLLEKELAAKGIKE